MVLTNPPLANTPEKRPKSRSSRMASDVAAQHTTSWEVARACKDRYEKNRRDGWRRRYAHPRRRLPAMRRRLVDDDMSRLLRLFRSWKLARISLLACLASFQESGLGFACACWALEPLGTRSVTWQCNESELETDQGKRRGRLCLNQCTETLMHWQVSWIKKKSYKFNGYKNHNIQSYNILNVISQSKFHSTKWILVLHITV